MADDAAAVSEGLALAPILLIVAAAAVLGVAIYELWTHWSTVCQGWIKGAAVDVWDWIKTNWPLLLGIITGPIGLAVVEVVKHWQAIKDGAASAVQWIKDRFNDVVSFFTGLGGRISSAVSGMWDGIFSAFRSVIVMR